MSKEPELTPEDQEILEEVQEETGVEERSIDGQMKRSYLEYAMSVIVGRALPDARDGLKPVQRRILYAMHSNDNKHSKPYVKSAQIVGETMGKYHPHGDSAIYETMVRMAQDWQFRAPLIDGQGNWGSIDGDGAAAMRYSEARMTPITAHMLTDLDQDTIDWNPNYDGSKQEPSVLPARFPALLVNGAAGIAVGMATQIPPHNLKEVVAGLGALIDNPKITIPELMEYIKAPDLPTGGIIVGREGIRRAYETGRGRLIVRGVSHIEERSSGRESIVITELPYTVQKGDGRGDGSGLYNKIRDLVHEKKLPEISDVRDESGKDIRLVIDLKTGTMPQVVLNKLYKHTSLQLSTGINMVALNHGQPMTMNLKQLLEAYLAHQVEVVTRRSRFKLKRARSTAHILEGKLIALSHLDRVIEIIRTSDTESLARELLMTELKLSKEQARAITDMRLGQLSSTDIGSVQSEFDGLTLIIKELRAILGSEKAVLEIVRSEVGAVADKFGDARRSEIIAGEGTFDIEDLIPETSVAVLLTKSGYLKRVPLEDFRAQSRGGVGSKGIELRDEEDALRMARIVSTHEWLLCFTNKGKMWRLRGWEVPEGGRQSKGRSLANILALEEGEEIVALCSTKDFGSKANASDDDTVDLEKEEIDVDEMDETEAVEGEDTRSLIFITRKGLIKKSMLAAYQTNFKSIGLKAINLADDDELVSVEIAEQGESVIVLSRKGRVQRFEIDKVRALGRSASGVRAMKLDQDELVSLSVHDDEQQLLVLTEDGYGKRVPMSEFKIKNRGGLGVRVMPEGIRGLLVGGVSAKAGDELLVLTTNGMVQRLKTDDVSSYSRGSKGVRIMKLGKDDLANVMGLVGSEYQKAEAAVSEDEDNINDVDVENGLVDETDIDSVTIDEEENQDTESEASEQE